MHSLNFLGTIISILLLLHHMIPCEAQLSATFYHRSCPNATTIIANSIRRAISREPRMAASLIRLHFHDCFVQGCDASILLDQTSTIQTEKTAVPNANSVRGYDVIEAAKRDVERACPGVVSCADILTLAARDASAAVGGPSWKVRLGRRDSTTASRSEAETDLPSPFADLDTLISAFAIKGLNARDLVALSEYTATEQTWTVGLQASDSNLAPLDLTTPDSLDNAYFRNLEQRKGLLQSDQVLFSGSTARLVSQYTKKPQVFAAHFAAAMIKMGEIEVLLGRNGIIRRACNAIN